MIVAFVILAVGISAGIAYKRNCIQIQHSAGAFSIRLVEVVYGKPDSKLLRDAEAGKVFLGGCDASAPYPPRVLLINWPTK
jgi:hypothetical protein